MAKEEWVLQANLSEVVGEIDNEVLQGSISATLEDSSCFQMGEIQCVVRVYERYSFIGGNRVSLSVTLMGDRRQTFVSAIASGGSQGIFFKINTFGEDAFLDGVRRVLARYQ